MEYRIVKALVNNRGPQGEEPSEIRRIILWIMEPYNMHHVPSEEMEELDLDCYYLAVLGGDYVGACGYAMLSKTQGKTTLLSVLPQYSGLGIGRALQEKRVGVMQELGATSVITNADRPASIAWYKRQGYVEVGNIPKVHSFGWDGADCWTTLELSLEANN